MALCVICASIPVRRALEGDPSLPVGKVKGKLGEAHIIQHHASSTSWRLAAQHAHCARSLLPTLNAASGNSTSERTKMPAKECGCVFPLGAMEIGSWTYLGDEELETQIFGRFMRVAVGFDDPLADVVQLRHVQSNPTHDLALTQIDSWLNICDREHEQCSHVTRHSTQLPARVLDLHQLPDREEMLDNKAWNGMFQERTLNRKHTESEEKGRYKALCYWWGTPLAYKATKENRDEQIGDCLVTYQWPRICRVGAVQVQRNEDLDQPLFSAEQ